MSVSRRQVAYVTKAGEYTVWGMKRDHKTKQENGFCFPPELQKFFFFFFLTANKNHKELNLHGWKAPTDSALVCERLWVSHSNTCGSACVFEDLQSLSFSVIAYRFFIQQIYQGSNINTKDSVFWVNWCSSSLVCWLFMVCTRWSCDWKFYETHHTFVQTVALISFHHC